MLLSSGHNHLKYCPTAIVVNITILSNRTNLLRVKLLLLVVDTRNINVKFHPQTTIQRHEFTILLFFSFYHINKYITFLHPSKHYFTFKCVYAKTRIIYQQPKRDKKTRSWLIYYSLMGFKHFVSISKTNHKNCTKSY